MSGVASPRRVTWLDDIASCRWATAGLIDLLNSSMPDHLNL
ncbi:hypothetical protein [Oculatella sp. LEGE 06141]|nr:hypothetical protein [Oculatella sp. LEGE 06141]